jgi:hypothetical protein
MLVRCLYASRAAKAALAPAVIDQVLEQSQRSNLRKGITGLLCFTGDIFVQVLEGGRDEVCELFNVIVRDDRHQDVRLLVYEEILERHFANWTMGQVKIESINPALLMKYYEKAELNPFSCSGKATMALLLELLAAGVFEPHR